MNNIIILLNLWELTCAPSPWHYVLMPSQPFTQSHALSLTPTALSHTFPTPAATWHTLPNICHTPSATDIVLLVHPLTRSWTSPTYTASLLNFHDLYSTFMHPPWPLLHLLCIPSHPLWDMLCCAFHVPSPTLSHSPQHTPCSCTCFLAFAASLLYPYAPLLLPSYWPITCWLPYWLWLWEKGGKFRGSANSSNWNFRGWHCWVMREKVFRKSSLSWTPVKILIELPALVFACAEFLLRTHWSHGNKCFVWSIRCQRHDF